jgi:hypothetical protein
MSQNVTLSILNRPSQNLFVFGWRTTSFFNNSGRVGEFVLEIRYTGTPWNRAFVRRQIGQAWVNRQVKIGNLPINRNMEARIVAKTGVGGYVGGGQIGVVIYTFTSNTISFNTSAGGFVGPLRLSQEVGSNTVTVTSGTTTEQVKRR